MSRRKKAEEAAFHDGWESACSLYRVLAEGKQVPGMRIPGLLLENGETCYSDTELDYARFSGADVSVTYRERRGSFTISPSRMLRNAVDKAADRRAFARLSREAEQLAAPQWRDYRRVRAVLTNYRILCDVDGTWLSFWHRGVVQFTVVMSEWAFELRFTDGEPLRLAGPDAPAYALAVAYLREGSAALQQGHFAPLVNATNPPTR